MCKVTGKRTSFSCSLLIPLSASAPQQRHRVEVNNNNLILLLQQQNDQQRQGLIENIGHVPTAVNISNSNNNQSTVHNTVSTSVLELSRQQGSGQVIATTNILFPLIQPEVSLFGDTQQQHGHHQQRQRSSVVGSVQRFSNSSYSIPMSTAPTTTTIVSLSSSSSSYQVNKSEQQVSEQRNQQQQQLSVSTPLPKLLRDDCLSNITEYQRFVLFVKILVKILEENHEHTMIQFAKVILLKWRIHCFRNNINESTVNCQDISDLCRRLRSFIQEVYWKVTSDYLGYSCA
jgi:hypothetical protein